MTERSNQKKFFRTLQIPVVLQSDSNQRNMETLRNLLEDLKISIRSSIKKCCCFRFDDIIFGRLDQAKFILMETFDGKHVFIDGPDNNKLDCMFFPCTSKEEVLINDSVNLDGSVNPNKRKSLRNSSKALT